MKSLPAVQAELAGKLERHWHTWLALEAAAHGAQPGPVVVPVPAHLPPGPQEGIGQGPEQVESSARPPAWPVTIGLAAPAKERLQRDFTSVNAWALTWQQAQREHDLTVRWVNRRVYGTTQPIPDQLSVPDLTEAARVAGHGWPTRLRTAQRRWQQLRGLFGPRATAGTLRAVAGLSDVDFELLSTVARWVSEHDPAGMTARQLPIEGVHGKWLNAHQRLVCQLSGRDHLGLVHRPRRVEFTYLDPQHRAAGLRRHDSYAIGDSSAPLYRPHLALLCENKDTVLLFPPVPDAVSVLALGSAAGLLTQVPWLTQVPRLLYWGDIDAAGFEILDRLRGAGLDVQSLLMDEGTYDRYGRFGIDTDAGGKLIVADGGKDVPHLTEQERAVYRRVCDPAGPGPRRVEQERIPLHEAHAAVLATLTAPVPSG